jgi:hypothetical protein
MAKTQTKTGKAGSITIAGNVVPITKWSRKVSVEFADDTDSGNYDAGTGNLYKSQPPATSRSRARSRAGGTPPPRRTNVTAKIKAPGVGPLRRWS